MISADDFKQHCAQLTDPNTSPDRRRKLAGEVRDSIELVHSHEYPNFLSNYLPAFETVLRTTTTPQQFDDDNHKTRVIILEIISRLPANENLKNHAQSIFDLAFHVLQTDNEENAVSAIQIIFDLYKSFRQDLEEQVKPFLVFVRRLYENFGNTVKNSLSPTSPIIAHSQTPPRYIPLSTQSFKVITECPLLVMCVFQIHPQMRKSNMSHLCPLMVSAIEQEVPINTLHPALRNTYQEFIASQVKTVSFLAYLLKQSPDNVQTNQISIPRSVVKLLQSCPGNSISIRKELLVATRLILSSSFKQGFFDQLDLLLNESVLVGTTRSSTDSLRPLAYLFLTELIHHVRINLSIDQFNKVIYMFSTNIHDPKFSYVQQASAVRLLMNLMEGILAINRRDKSKAPAARVLLIRILDTIVAKFITLGDQVPRLIKIVQDLRDNPDPIASGKRLSELPVIDPLKEVAEFKQLVRYLTPSLKTVVWSAMTTRTPDLTLSRSASASPGQYNDQQLDPNEVNDGAYGSGANAHKGLLEKECEIITELLPASRKCFRLYSRLEKANGGPGTVLYDEDADEVMKESKEETNDANNNHLNSNVVCATEQEERDIFEQFAHVFTVLDVACFQDIFGLRMQELFEHIVENPHAISIPQHFLAAPAKSKYFADILLNFLAENLHLLDVPSFSISETTKEARKAAALLKLFRIMFASVNLFPSNEPVLRLHVATIIRKSLKYAIKAEDPHAYLTLLRGFFKAITNGKHNTQFEVLYREFCPFIEPLFQGLMTLYHAPNNLVHRDTIIELCLVIPARPSTIFPFLELQMKPVVWSLKNPMEIKENTVVGLKALEFWIDMLQPSFMESLLNRVEPTIVSILQDHLHSPESTAAKYAARILGKLGPRARSMTTLTSPFQFKKYAKSAQQILLNWSDRQFLDMDLDEMVELSGNALLDKRMVNGSIAPWRYKAETFMFLHSLLVPLLGICDQNETDERLMMGIPIGLKAPKDKDPTRKQAKTKFEIQADENQVAALLTPLIATCHLSKLKSAIDKVKNSNAPHTNPVEEMESICRYFAALCVQDHSNRHLEEKKPNSFEVDTTERKSWRSLSPSLFTSAILDVISFENEEFVQSGVQCLKSYLEALVTLSTDYKKEQDPYAVSNDNDTDANSGNDQTGKVASGQDTKNHDSASATDGKAPMDVSNATGAITLSNNVNATGNSRPSRRQVAVLPNVRGAEDHARTLHPGERVVVVRHVIELVEQFSHFCHRKEWNVKRAGVLGIEVLYDVIPELFMRSQYYPSVHFHSYRAMLHVSHGAGETVTKRIIEKVKKIVFRIIDYCFDPGSDQTLRNAVISSKMLKDFTNRVGVELMSEWPCTREIARLSLERMAKVLGLTVLDFLRQLKDGLCKPLIQRTIRVHSLGSQIGYVECIIFFLQQGKEKFTADLFKSPLKEHLLNECIAVFEQSTFDPTTESEEGFRSKSHDSKCLNTRNTKLLLLLRRKIVELLCNVANFSTELSDPSNDKLFRHMISCFFKSLQSGDEEIVKSAKVGLKQAISKHPKPKELLQVNLKPILGYLTDYKKLSVTYLQTLSRVLELFSHWFNLSMGDRLLIHLQRWTEPEKFSMGGGNHFKWTPGTESKVGAAILDLFHLLPPSASKFLPKIVPMAIRLESVLPVAGPGVAHLGLKGSKAASTSPYRAPLLRYCDHHANVATTYFLQHISDDKKRQLLMVMVRSPEAKMLRKDFMDHPRRLTPGIVFNPDHTKKTPFHIISLIDLLTEYNPAWISSDPEILSKLTIYWHQLCQVPDILVHGPSTLARIEEMKTLSHIFIKYCTHFPEKVTVMFLLLAVFSTRTVCDFSFVKDFMKKMVSKEGSYATKKLIITTFLDMFHDRNIPQERKVYALQHLVIPMVCLHLKRKKDMKDTTDSSSTENVSQKAEPVLGDSRTPQGQIGNPSNPNQQNNPLVQNTTGVDGPVPAPAVTAAGDPAPEGTPGQLVGQNVTDMTNPTGANPQDEVLDGTLIERIMKEILDQSDEVLRHYDEPLSAELLRLVTELIKYMPRELGGYRKELIKFGWGHLKREESSAKHWAFVYVTTFFEAYTAPGKIILQVYVALLRAFHQDGRELVQQALDILTPALPKRLVHNPSEHRFPIWIRYTKKILLEEGHNTLNLIHILQLIIRHHTLFYVARSWFVPIMAQTLTRIGLTGNTGNTGVESKRLWLDLISVIIDWERYRRTGSWSHSKEGESRKRPRDAITAAGQENTSNGANDSMQGTMTGSEIQEPPSKTKKAEDGQAIPTSTTQGQAPVAKDSENFEPGNNIVDTIFGFLVQIPFRAPDRREAPMLLKRSVSLIEEASKIWSKFNVAMNFVPKTYEVEKAAIAQQKNYAASLQQSINGSIGPDGKTTKPETKQELARLKRHASRPATLYTALSLMLVLTKYQKERFLNWNMEAISLMVMPALNEADAQTSFQCTALIRQLLEIYPIQPRVPTAPDSMQGVVQPGNTAQPNPAVKQGGENLSPVASMAQNVYTNVHNAIHNNLSSDDPMRVYFGLSTLQIIVASKPDEFQRHQELVVKSFQTLRERFNNIPANVAHSHGGPSGGGGSSGDGGSSNTVSIEIGAPIDHSFFDPTRLDKRVDFEIEAIRLCLYLLGRNITSLDSAQRKVLFQLIASIIDRSAHIPIPILLEMVDLAGIWVFWTPREDQKTTGQVKDPLMPKEKINILLKLATFERVKSDGADRLMNAFLKLILRIFGGENPKEKRPELIHKLQRVFLLGLKTSDLSIRERFFKIFSESMDKSLASRMSFVICKQDWELFGECIWIRYACELLIASAIAGRPLVSDISCSRFPRLMFRTATPESGQRAPWKVIQDPTLVKFIRNNRSSPSNVVLDHIRTILQFDAELAHSTWIDLFPKIWTLLSENDRNVVERGLCTLLSKEYHHLVMTSPQNNIRSLLESIVRCRPLPVIRANLIQHLGSRWNAWHSALAYFELRLEEIDELANMFPDPTGAASSLFATEADELRDAQVRIFRQLQEKDYVAGVWKLRAESELTSKALTYEQLGMHREAFDLYNSAMLQEFTKRGTDLAHNGMPSKEFLFWEDSWVNCARNLCQWDVLTEFSRSVLNHELMHECLWRVPDWAAMKETLLRNPMEDGPQLKIYESFLYMQENKMDHAEKSVSDGIDRAIEKFKALPKSADLDSRIPLLVNLQQFAELTDSANIFAELNDLSGHSAQSISIDQKVDNVRLRLNTWRERLPCIHEPLPIWSDILTWRNHMHAIIVNVLENLKEAAAQRVNSPQSIANTPGGRINPNIPPHSNTASAILNSLPPQVCLMGVNETAWNNHRFARAARKQEFPEISLYAMNKMYPFGSMDLFEYFVKTKELARAFLGRPKGLDRSIENGLYEIDRCHMEHFSPRQKTQLFTLKSKLLSENGRDADAAEALGIALNTASDVGSTWLTWGRHCDRTQSSLANDNAFMKDKFPGEDKLTLEDAPFLNLKTELAWREATVNCYLQAIRFGSRGARPYLARVLRLLIIDVNARRNAEYVMERITNRTGKDGTSKNTMDTNQNAMQIDSGNQNMTESERSIKDNIVWSVNTGVSKVIAATTDDVPVWMWIPWLSQMVHMLARMEGVIVRPLLVKVAQHFPQALFYLVRSYIEERKLIDKPTKVMFKEAMKTGRPLIPTPRAGLALQATLINKQLQSAKETYERSLKFISAKRQSIDALQKDLTSITNPTERPQAEARIMKLQEELQVAKVNSEKCVVNIRHLQQKQHQLHANLAEGSNGQGNVNSGDKRNSAQGSQQNTPGDGASSMRNSGSGKIDGSKLDSGTIHMTPYEQADVIMTQIVKSNTGLAMDLERVTLEISSRLKPQREEHLLNVMSVLLRQCYRTQVRVGKKVEPSLRQALADVSKMCFRTGMETDPNEQKLPGVMMELKKAFESELAPQVAKDFPTDMEKFIQRIRRWQIIFQRRVNAFPEHMKIENVSKYMLDVKDSEVEVFGQYECADSMEPAPENHIRIDQFESEIKVVHGSSHPCRGIKLLGTDGRLYEFALETSGAIGVQAAEERTIQMYRLLNSWVFSKNPVAVQRRIKLATPILVPTGSRSRLISMESKDLTTVVEGLNKYLEEHGKDSDEAVVQFRNLSSEILNKKWVSANANGDLVLNGSNSDKGKSEYNQNQIAARVEAYKQICDKHVPDTCLRDWLTLKMKSWDHRFTFTKRFAETLGACCISSHCLGVGARRPQMMVVRWSTGGIWNLNVRVLTSSTGVLESDEAVPFRLTRNIVRMTGDVGMGGPLMASMVTTLRSIQKECELIKMVGELVLRDELTVWVNAEMRRSNSQSQAAAGRETSKRLSREEYRLLEDRMKASGKAMVDRMFGKERQRGDGKDGKEGKESKHSKEAKDSKIDASSVDVGEIVHKWIDKARDVNNLALMEVSWQPWY